ncbi:reverse transcriptase domain-containing protein [Bacillus cereus]|uniref:reverse transcriptase domain-containing protein n=1 Tax=Bacillus cereus group TaxID=86661 RepID=UPI000279D20F|nr:MULTISPECIES: reverse transcriptase domain-containing protein [Bacillus cereus group]EJR73625.1 hypothetical protein IK9_05160 [Bacillus cereus VD166]MDZ4631668.1 reverse transcriptase domain-containing protein [Bacillus cereus]PGX74513.1 hypothetical protein COE45_28520 [Bacillus thuringiensis]USL10758.1 hypothetical protein LIT24_28885 [Bacillus bombysepticus]
MKAVFESIINSYDDEQLTNQINSLFDKVKSQEVDFSKNIERLVIKQNQKKRRVLNIKSKTVEDIALKFLKKRLDIAFKIKYPDRKKIMKECFSIIETIPSMSDFVIFKYDFKDFFESVLHKEIFEKYIKYSDLYRYEKDLLEDITKNFKYCSAGLPTSNAVIEIISREFDLRLKSKFYNRGLIFYSRYVDDSLLIFNQFIEQDQLLQTINETIEEVFSNCKVKINPGKMSYLSMDSTSDTEFTYLGYLFNYKKINQQGKNEVYFQYGIDEEKLEKYRKKIMKIVEDFQKNGDIELFRQRLLFWGSRVVFHNTSRSSYSTTSNWDVIGIIANYGELRHFVTKENKVEKETMKFLTYEVIKIIKSETGTLPYFLKKNPDGYLLKNRLCKNRSIIFHPKIGWTKTYLIKKLMKLDPSISVSKKSYRQLVKDYCDKIKI